MKYGLIGSLGRMGKEIASVFSEAEHELVMSYDVDGENFSDTPEVIVDFSLPAAYASTIAYVQQYNVPLVLGTTGLNEEDFAVLKELSKKVAVVQSYNFSLGVQMMLRCIETVKGHLKNWDVEMTETHHRFKKDKPSGTAIMMKNALGKEAPISSLRLGNIAGIHNITFASLGETLTIEHSATSRRTFAEGVLLSAQFCIGKAPGIYTFKDVIDSIV